MLTSVPEEEVVQPQPQWHQPLPQMVLQPPQLQDHQVPQPPQLQDPQPQLVTLQQYLLMNVFRTCMDLLKLSTSLCYSMKPKDLDHCLMTCVLIGVKILLLMMGMT